VAIKDYNLTLSSYDFDVVVVGAGAVGLAIACAVSKMGKSVLVLDQNERAAAVTSSRSSQVVHAGIYYPTGSLKHRMCIEGRQMLYEFMERFRVPYQKCGKLVVATDHSEEEKLLDIFRLGEENGVQGLRLLSRAEANALEPELSIRSSVWSPESGIFDVHEYIMRLLAIFEDAGGTISLRTSFIGAKATETGFEIQTDGLEPMTIKSGFLINAGGLWAMRIASSIEGFSSSLLPNQWLAKGSYFKMSRPMRLSHLIYPVPVDGGLGVHATVDLAGIVRFGPDVEWLSYGTDPGEVDYSVAEDKVQDFEIAVRRYLPNLPEGSLVPDYSGVRPKISGPSAGFSDFVVQTEDEHNLCGLVNLFGIESPGLTASLAIGRYVAARVEAGSS